MFIKKINFLISRVPNGRDQKIYFFINIKKSKKDIYRVNQHRKTRFFDPKSRVSTKKRDILTFLDRKNHFLIIKDFFIPRTNFFKAGFGIFAAKNLGIDTKIVIF